MSQVTAEQFAQECDGLNKTLGSDWSRPLGQVAVVLHGGIARNFAEKRGGQGPAWPPRKDTLPHPLLDQTGALKAAATGKHGAASVERIVGGNELQLGVDKAVDDGAIRGAAVHNFGFPPRNIPQREYLVVDGATIDEAVEIVADDAVRQLGW